MTLEVTYSVEPYASGSCRVMVTLELPRGSICSIQVGTDAWTELWRALGPFLRLAQLDAAPEHSPVVPRWAEDWRPIFTGTQVPLP